MKKQILLATLPLVALTACNKGTYTEITRDEWAIVANLALTAVDFSVEEEEYPFTTYTMKGTDGETDLEDVIDSKYVFTGTKETFWSSWEYYPQSEIPTRMPYYEMYTAVDCYNHLEEYFDKEGNSFKWFKDGDKFGVEANHTDRSLTKNKGTLLFDSYGFVSSINIDYGTDFNRHLKLNFVYSK